MMNLQWLSVIFLLAVATTTTVHRYDVMADDNAEYVKEVLEEDQQQHDENEYYHEDSHYEKEQQQQEDVQKRRQAEEDRLVRDQADRAAAERERDFQTELDRMNADEQKAALRQKKKDSRMVRSVLKAAEKKKHYGVLGIKNWNLKLPSRTIQIAGMSFTIPGFTVKETSMKDIRKAYRNRAMATHPDKNKDGRAKEAFIEVENSASILSDNSLRQKYDKAVRLQRLESRNSQLDILLSALASAQNATMKILKAVHKLLGPFTTPVIILGALLV